MGSSNQSVCFFMYLTLLENEFSLEVIMNLSSSKTDYLQRSTCGLLFSVSGALGNYIKSASGLAELYFSETMSV